MSASIQVLPITDLNHDPNNARIHPDQNRLAIQASLSRFGAGRSVVLDGSNVVRAGNGTLDAAYAEGFREVVVIEPQPGQLVAVRRPDWSNEQASAYAIADNRTSETAQWDDRRVAETLAAISNPDNRAATGFSDADVASLLASLADSTIGPPESHGEPSRGLPASPANPADADPPLGGESDRSETGSSVETTNVATKTLAERHAELAAKWRTESGQVWEIPSLAQPGRSHRLVIGDCADLATVRKACPRGVQGVVTSPPYAEQRKGQYRGIPADQYVEWFEPIQYNLRHVLAQDGSVFINIKPHCEDGERHLYVNDLIASMRRRWDWRYIDEFAWIRSSAPGAWPNRFKNGFEPVYHFATHKDIKFRPLNVATIGDGSLIGVKADRETRQTGSGFGCKPESAKQTGLVLPSNVIQVNVGANVSGHSATYPVGVPLFFVKAFSDPGDVWFDPFLGSGTTILACEQSGRLGAGCEEMPSHAAVCLERLASEGMTPRLV